MGKILKFNHEARGLILAGIDELEKAVTSTLGPKGHCVIIDNGTIRPLITKDGVSVARAIEFKDKYKNIGAHLVQEAARKTNAEAGDGTTTCTLITSELCKAGNELVNQNFDAVEIKRGFEAARNDIIDALEKQKKVIESEDDILHIATISANNDEEIGRYICEAYTCIGEGGIVGAVDAKNRKGATTVTFSNGLEIPKGYFGSAVANQDDGKTCYFENPKFLVYGDVLNSLQDIAAVFNVVRDPVVIVAPAYSEEFQVAFLDNVKNRRIQSVAFGPDGSTKDILNENLGDIAALVGATIIGGKKGTSIDDFTLDMLGSAESIKVGPRSTTIMGGRGSEEKIQERVNTIKDKIEKGNSSSEDDAMSPYEIDYCKKRIANLTGGVATIHVGGYTDVEVKEKIDRYEDAINAVNAAIDEGIIAGGGAGLLHAINIVNKKHTEFDNAVKEIGYQSFLKVMEMPARLIIGSTGKDPGYYSEMIKVNESNNYGFNAKKEEFSYDMYKDGVIDPVKVTETAIKYGTSVACTFISSDCVIIPDVDNVSMYANDEVMDEEVGGYID